VIGGPDGTDQSRGRIAGATGVAHSFRASPTANPEGPEREGLVFVSPVPTRAAIRLGAVIVMVAAALLPAAALASVSRLGARVLRPGMRGSDVRSLQIDLTRAGVHTTVTGVFNAATRRSVVRFERENQLPANGRVDTRFVRKLNRVLIARSITAVADSGGNGGTGLGGGGSTSSTSSSSSGSSSSTTGGTVRQDGGSQHLGERTLRLGLHGHDVRVLQNYLTLAGFRTPVDGQFGPTTKRNVIRFERSRALRANGVLTYRQALSLRAAVATIQATTSAATGKAQINPDGTATEPAGAPQVVQQVIAAANQIITTPYKYGGGHSSFTDTGYDCSGAVSYALHGGGLLSSPEDSSTLESYGSTGPGKWITVYADAGHTWVVVAGIAFDTANYGGPNIPSGSGPRWRRSATGNLRDGGNYVVRHPAGF
jgi:peptidoglycan hydrolase-like protein with peptidoglycan-binding domain